MSKIPGQKSDQRKIYIDWANNKLRKNGSSEFIHDLQKDTADGVKLPRIIQAVIQEEVPATFPSVSSDIERRQNIEACVVFLQRKGVNCSGFTSKDICEGSMRAILQLFYCLSQYKGVGGGKGSEGGGDHPPSRISRPTSPSLRLIHSVHNVSSNMSSASSSHSSHPNTGSGLQPMSHHTSTKISSNPTSPLSPPTNSSLVPPSGGGKEGNTTVHPSGSSLKSRPSQRRTAGSTIPTGMDYMGNQRRVQYKNINVMQNEDSKSGDESKEQSPPVSVAAPLSSTPPTTTSKLLSSGSGLKLPEGPGVTSPGLKHPISSLKSPTGSTGSSSGGGIRPPGGGGGLKAPANLQSSLKSPNVETPPTSHLNKSDITEKDSSDSKLKSIPNAKAQRSLSMGRSVTPGIGSTSSSRLMKQSSMTTTVPSDTSGSGISRPGGAGGRLQMPSSSKIEKSEPEGGQLKQPESSAATVTKSKTLDYKSGLSGPGGGNIPGPSSGLTGPSRIGGGRNNYQNIKLQNKDSEKTFGLSQHGGTKAMVDKKDSSNSPEPERSMSMGSVSKPSKLMGPLSFKPSGGSPPSRHHSSESLPLRADSSKSDSSECLSDNENKSVSKLALITQKQPQSPVTNKSLEFTSRESSCELSEKTPEPVSVPESLPASVPAPVSEPAPILETEPVKTPETSKPKLPPLDITATPTETSPSKTDNRSSGSSIGSFTSSLNSQSESSILDMQTPSPIGGRKYVRRTSPEGMSVDETASPRDMNKLSDLSNEEGKEEVFSLMSSGEDLENAKEKENLLAIETGLSSKVKRAQSLSPKASRRIMPLQQPTNQPSLSTRPAVANSRGKPSRSSYDHHMGSNAKPRSVLRGPRQPGDMRSGGGKHVTISPHSSVESFSSSDNSLVHLNSSMEERNDRLSKRSSQTERPKSLEDLESHQFSIGGYPGDLHPHLLSNNLARRGSTRSNYSDENAFLQEKMMDESRGSNATPEVLLETYENELSTLKKDLESKAKMLNMYESSMQDLSTKVTTLKRSLEEKDQAIKHLTEEKQKWNEFPFDTHSLAPSRIGVDSSALSDGGYSDGTPEYEESQSSKKSSKKKSGLIGRLRTKRSKNKENELQQAEVASLAGGPSGQQGRKKSGKSQPHDLMSISEYSTIEGKMPEFDSKSCYYDTRSEYGSYMPTIITEETGILIYEEEGEGVEVTVELLTDNALINKEGRLDTVVLGALRVPPETSWVTMDTKICDIFKHHMAAIDPDGALGVNDDSIHVYYMGNVSRAIGNALLPPTTPYQALDGATEMSVTLKGTPQESCDALAYCLLVSASQLHSYIAMLLETQWIVVMGTKGTCKSTLAEGLARYLELLVKEEQSMEDEIGLIGNEDDPLVTRFSIASSIGSNSGDGLDNAMRFIKNELPHRINRSSRTPILLFDNVYDCQTIEQLISAAGSLSKRPYIISTLCSGGTTRGVPLHQLMFRHNIRVVTCSPTEEPIYGILTRTLRKRLYRLKAADEHFEKEAEILVNWLPLLLDHLNDFINKFHSNNVALGPRVFMNCPLKSSSNEMETWFINLWNHFIIPYLMGTIMAGIETYSADPNLLWIDVREWAIETYPWQQSSNVNKLKTLTPEDVGWNHAVRPQHNRYMPFMKDDDTQSVLRMKGAELAI